MLTVLFKNASYPDPVARAIGTPCLCYSPRHTRLEISLLRPRRVRIVPQSRRTKCWTNLKAPLIGATCRNF